MKIGILCTTTLNKFNFEVLSHIAIKHHGHEIICFADNRPRKLNMARLIEEVKMRRGFYVLMISTYKLSHKKFRRVDTASFCKSRNIKYLETSNPCSTEFIDTVNKVGIDILVHLGSIDSTIRKPLLEAVPLGILAYHHGDLREYRGQPPAFWELFCGESSVVTTIEKLSEWTDTGMPVLERVTEIKQNDSLGKLRKRVFTATTDMMSKALEMFYDENYKPVHPGYYGTLYTYPTLWECVVLQYRVSRRKARFWFSQLNKLPIWNLVLPELKSWQR